MDLKLFKVELKEFTSLKFKTVPEAKRLQKRVGGRVVKAPFKVLKVKEVIL